MLTNSCKVLFFCFLLLTVVSCISDSDKVINKITYSDDQLSKLKEHLLMLEDVFSKLRDKLPTSQIGFIVVDSTIRYRHCFDSIGNYIDTTNCNFNALLNDIDKTKLIRAISYLKSNKIVGSFFPGSLDSDLLILDVNYREFGDSRYLYLFKENDLKLTKAPFDILDRKKDFYLLKDRL